LNKQLLLAGIGIALVLVIYMAFTNKPPAITAFDEKRSLLLDSLEIPGEERLRELEVKLTGKISDAELDSLSHGWYHAGYPDIAADFDRQLADRKPSVAAYMRAGQTFFEALPTDTSQTMQVNLVYGARYCYEQALAIDSNYLDARIGLAQVFVQGTNEPMKGIMMLRELDAQYPGNVAINMELGRFSVMSGQYDKAIERFNSVLQKDSLHLQARFLLAESFMAVGDTVQAVKTLEKTIGLTGDPVMDDQVRQYIESLTK
jgi:lipopolysaccharide biosynthesis regulator YciM